MLRKKLLIKVLAFKHPSFPTPQPLNIQALQHTGFQAFKHVDQLIIFVSVDHN